MNEIENLTRRIEALESAAKGTSISTELTTKDVVFNGRVHILNRTALPTNCQEGDVAIKNGSLYVCSATDTWTATGGSAFGGHVDSAATAEVVPTGWSATLSGTIYTVTHNLNNSSYGVVFSVPSFALNPVLQSKGVNSFTVDFENSSGTASATEFDFVLVVTV